MNPIPKPPPGRRDDRGKHDALRAILLAAAIAEVVAVLVIILVYR